MRQKIESIIQHDPIAVIILGATLLTGISLLACSTRAWLLVLIIPGIFTWLAHVAKQPAKWRTSLAQGLSGLAFFALMVGQDRYILSNLFPFFVPCIQLLLFTVLLFPLAYFWEGPVPKTPVHTAEDENPWLIAVLVLVEIAFCVGIGWLVNQNTSWIWLILSLWVLVFPKGVVAHNFSLLSGFFGFLGLMILIVSVLMGWIPQHMMFTASGYGFGIMLLITIMMWISVRRTRSFPARAHSSKH